MNTKYFFHGCIDIVFFITAIVAFGLLPSPAHAVVPVDCFPHSFSSPILNPCYVWDVGATGRIDTAGLPLPIGTTLTSLKEGHVFNKEVFALGNLITNPLSALQNAMSALSWDSFGWMMARQILHVFTQEMVSWIRTGQFGGGPLFTTDLVGELFNVADNAAGHFLAQYRSEEWYKLLCSPFRPHIYLALGRGRVPYIERARCTVTDIVDNLESFYSDFSNGGWAAWFSTIEPQNNPYGLYLLSLEEKERREREVTFDIRHNFLAGQGFIGLKRCKAGAAIQPGKIGYVGDGSKPFCPPDKYETVTPGKVVEDQLIVALGPDIKKLEVADELNEVIAATFDSLLSWLVSGGSNGGGLLGSRLPDLPPITPICSTDTGRPNGCGCTIATQCASNFCSPNNICAPPPSAAIECKDNIDNDRDTFIDFPADPQCTSPEDTSESEEGRVRALKIVSASPLPSGTTSVAYSFQFLAEGGTPFLPGASTFPYQWTAVDTGTHPLPAGLTLSQSGALSGTPTAVGTWTFTVKVTDSVASSTQGAFLLTIIAP